MRRLIPSIKYFIFLKSRPLLKWHYKGSEKFCPVCESHVSKFLPFGVTRRENARCLVCHSLERHRLVWIFLRDWTDLFDGKIKKMLHIAPEREFEHRFKNVNGLEYLSADLSPSNAMIQMDITNIQFPENFFDVIYCSHVFEHIPDDKKAMREILRVLHPNGWALLQVPITAEKTIEDPSIRDPMERLQRFGQKDHIRRYGPDYPDRLKESGFFVEKLPAATVVDERELDRFGIVLSESIFFCTKTENYSMEGIAGHSHSPKIV
jgi:hypothetical protein